MANSAVKGRAQVRGLLLRTFHRQKRDYCNNFCIFIIPPILLVLLASLPSIIRGRVEPVTSFEKDPRGAFALRPFPPLACKDLASVKSKEGVQKALAQCQDDPFLPKWTIPVIANPEHWPVLGSRNASSGSSSGILGELSLNPFIYPPAISDPFGDTQSVYDSIIPQLSNDFNVNSSFVQDVFISGLATVDRNFETATQRLERRSGQTPLLDLLFGDWYRGSQLGKYFGAYSFQRVRKAAGLIDVAATVFFNESSYDDPEMSSQLGAALVALESTIYSSVTNSTARAFIRKMPKAEGSNELGFVNLVIAVTICLTFHFLLPTFVHFLVTERQNRMRGLMAMMGLSKRMYWTGSYLGFFIMYLITSLISIVVGFGARLGFFTLNTPVSYLVLFFLWGNNLVAFAVFLAPFFRSADTALSVGWLYVILVNIVGGSFIGRRLRSDTAESTWRGIMVLPSFALMRSIYYVGGINASGKGVVIGSKVHQGIELGMCRGKGPFCTTYAFLIGGWFIFMILGLYFDRVLPGAIGGRLHPLFFLGFRRGASTDENNLAVHDDIAGEEEDVATERSKAAALAREMVFNPVDGVVVSDLRKTFFTGKRPVKAVQGISFVAQKGEIMGILGHNGAGKTTMFKMLVGEIEPTTGEAHVFGNSVVTNMRDVHSDMGVTPQENILWRDMTVEEHLFFYGRVKGLSGRTLKTSVQQSLAAVGLEFARKRLSSKCSGGMKRRLAVAISLTGNPSFIALDEPSTGLDILTREKLWASIQDAKLDKTVLLTTHSLEEAETLCDRVAIMSRGRLMCIGKPEELKLRLGIGNHLNISLPDSKIGELHNAMLSLTSEAKLDARMVGNVEYILPKSVPLSKIVSLIEEQRVDLQIYDWALSQSTLEDVFMSVTKRAADSLEQRQATGLAEP